MACAEGDTAAEFGDEGAVEIHTDGACSGNPGPGGWAAVLRWKGRERELAGGEVPTTNNRMELMAAIAALESLKRPGRVALVTDSQYLRKGITEWLPAWKARGWRTADKKPVKNQDLWQRLEAAATGHRIDWRWLKGHAGHPLNERADALAPRGDATGEPGAGAQGWGMTATGERPARRDAAGSMPLRFLALLLTALALVPVGAHLAEMPNKIGLGQAAYFTVQGVYRGWALFGIALVGATIADGALAIVARKDRVACLLAGTGFLFMSATLAVFFAWTYPANQATNDWASAPRDWEAWRLQWEYSHAANAALTLLALCAVVLASLRTRA